MEKYIFVLGKNWKLCLGELIHILNMNDFKGKIIDYSACVAIIEFEKEMLKAKQIADLQYILGGTLKIGKVIDFLDQKTFIKAFPYKIEDISKYGVMNDARKQVENLIKDSVYPIFGKLKNEKYFIANSIYPIQYKDPYYKVLIKHFLPFLNENWVKILKEKGARSVIYFKYPEKYMEEGTLNPIFPHHFFKYELYKPNRKEILYATTEEGIYLGYTLNATNPNMVKMVDEERPYKKFEASIPPKFVKIMINLLNLKRPYNTMKVLDPFVGSGTILLFAYSMGIQVYGADSNIECVEGTKKNLNWIKKYLIKPLKIDFNKNVINAKIEELSEKFANIKFHGIVTEPILTPVLKEIPKYEKINKIVQEQVIPTYDQAFKEFKKVLKEGSRISITAPVIETLDGGKISINLNEIALKYGLKSVKIIDKNKITEKSDINLKISGKERVITDRSSIYLHRQFFIFQK